MNNHSGIYVRLSLVLALTFFGAGMAAAQADSSVETCLMCHGPYTDLVAATSGYQWPKGEVLSPHQYVPHGSETIAECTYCHKPHEIPLTESDIAAKAALKPNYCFECHHTQKLTCGNCHAVELE